MRNFLKYLILCMFVCDEILKIMDKEIIIKIKDATLYNGKKVIFTNINLEVKQGEFVYLIGKIGSGKSTLIRTLNAELPLKSGEITIDGTSIQNIKRRHIAPLRKKLGVVFQDYKLLLDRSVYKNLLFVLQAIEFDKDLIDERIHEVLLKVGMYDHKNKMPHELSGGEQQRVVIARALLNNPDIILADEPTGNLDPETSDSLAALLHSICKEGKTVIMATHQHDLLKKFPARTIRCIENNLEEIESL